MHPIHLNTRRITISLISILFIFSSGWLAGCGGAAPAAPAPTEAPAAAPPVGAAEGAALPVSMGTPVPYPSQAINAATSTGVIQLSNWNTGMVDGLAWSPDGGMLATSTIDGDIRLWSGTDGSLIRIMGGEAGPSGSIAFATDGSAIAAGMLDGSILAWNGTDGSLRQTLLAHTRQVASLDYSQCMDAVMMFFHHSNHALST